jgi:UDP-N-acetylmuramate--alanine ligase
MFGKVKRIHLVGIGGAGMSGIAELLYNLGFKVTGSDIVESKIVKELKDLGIDINIGHSDENCKDAQVVVYSSAIPGDNPEIIWAYNNDVMVIPRAEMLAELMRLKKGIAVAGTHGKTTTTAILSAILSDAGLDPTMVVGGKLKSLGKHAKLGSSEYLVCEADESDGSFMKLYPIYVIVTNIDRDHLEHYGVFRILKDTFLKFINKVPFYGLAIICGDDENILDIKGDINRRYMTYGFSPQNDIRAKDIEYLKDGTKFTLMIENNEVDRFYINILGKHNVYNTLGAIGIANELDVEMDIIKDSLTHFDGIEMRFDILGESGSIIVMHDYAHHPTEIEATLDALVHSYDRRIICVFQPHRYSRTRDLMEEFGMSFNMADEVYIMDIYSAGEDPIVGVTSDDIVKFAKEYGHKNIHFVRDRKEIPAIISDKARKKDIVIFLGAGDIWKTARKTMEVLDSNEK